MRHFIEELNELQNKLLEMAGLVEASVHASVRSLVDRDEKQAIQVMKNEDRINVMEMEIDRLATRLLALQQPMAKDLRFLTAAMKINGDLERMGDLAVNMVKRAISLMERPMRQLPVDIPHMAKLVEAMVRKSLDAFSKRDLDLARNVLESDDVIDSLRDTAYQELVAHMQKEPEAIPEALDLIFVARNLERIADHATNIAEDVVYMIHGVDVRHHAEKM